MLPKQIGRYHVTAELGEGGMGRIFSAFDETLNRTVALKVISARAFDDDRARRLLLREARAAAALDHPFICTIHEVLEGAGEPVIVMERVVGETLTSRIRRGPLSIPQLSRYGIEIAEALAAAHARGIVHRDIKSDNIMLTESDHVKVMDFGLALISSPDAETLRRPETAAPRIVGTLPYMAPELWRGHEASTSSDLLHRGSGASLAIVQYDSNGNKIGNTITKNYAPSYFEQVALATFLGAQPVANGQIKIVPSSGQIIVYGSTTDNRTNDSSIYFASRP